MDSELRPSSGLGSVTGGPVRESEVSRVLGKLHIVTEHLQKHLSDLEQRLQGVLGPSIPKNTEKGINPEYATPVAQGVNDAVRRIEAAIEHVKELKSRVEL